MELWFANSSALLLSSLPSIFTTAIEYSILGLTVQQIVVLRIAYNIPKYSLSLFLGMITDALRRRYLTSKSGSIRSWVVDGAALSLYQIPIYMTCALLLGVKPTKVAIICAWYLVSSLMFGRLFYGFALDWIRSKHSLEKPNKAAL
jgi:hypothetical protein